MAEKPIQKFRVTEQNRMRNRQQMRRYRVVRTPTVLQLAVFDKPLSLLMPFEGRLHDICAMYRPAVESPVWPDLTMTVKQFDGATVAVHIPLQEAGFITSEQEIPVEQGDVVQFAVHPVPGKPILVAMSYTRRVDMGEMAYLPPEEPSA